MKDKCLFCEKRMMLVDSRFVLECRTTSANVHAMANAKQMVDGALDFVRFDKPNCARCETALTRANELLD